MKSIKTKIGTAPLLLFLALCVFLAGCAKLPQDDAGAKLTRFENLRGDRYTEMFLIGGDAITKNLKGGVYNTVGLHSPTGTGDTCPAEILDKVDIEALKKEYHVLAVFKNGPRLWTLDWVDARHGTGFQWIEGPLGDLVGSAQRN